MHQLFLPPTQLRNNLRSHLCNMRILRSPTPAISHWERQMDGTTFFNVISQRFPALRISPTWQSVHEPNMHNLSSPEAFKSPTTVDDNGFESKRVKHETCECTLSCSLIHIQPQIWGKCSFSSFQAVLPILKQTLETSPWTNHHELA